MKKILIHIGVKMKIARWAVEEDGTAFIEAAMLMPLLASMLMGVYDIGQGLSTNQRVIGASQIVGDLIARNRNLQYADLQDMIKAGELALDPYSKAPFGYDIVSVQFDADGNPVVLWRVTHNTAANDAAVDSTRGLGAAGDGLVVVTATYNYQPLFFNFFVDTINMKEVAFLHGRRSATVTCSDCPGAT